MSYVRTKRAGLPWTQTEHNRLVSAYGAGRTYPTIATQKAFKGKRTLKAIRRRMERAEFGY